MQNRVALVLSVLAVSLLGPASVGQVSAGAPLAEFQPPGFFRTRLGDVEVTALYDGASATDAVKMLDEPAQDTEAALRSSFLRNPVPTSSNVFLINTGARLILIDTGAGGMLGPSLGRLTANLRAAGYAPEQVDDILLTHMHRDHIDGLVADEHAVFPNAIVHADKRESDFWLSPEHLKDAPADQKPRFQGAVSALAPYIAAGHFKPFAADSEIVPMVRSMQAYGHSAGHTAYVVESKGEQLWLVGDLINVASVQFDRPQVSSAFDGDKPAASASREHILARAAHQGALVGGAHLPFPGLGHLRGAEAGWHWIEIDYSGAAG